MTTLRRFMHEESMRDSDAWLAKLMVADELLGGWVDGLQGKGVNRV